MATPNGVSLGSRLILGQRRGGEQSKAKQREDIGPERSLGPNGYAVHPPSQLVGFPGGKRNRESHLAGLQLSIATILANQDLIGLLKLDETATGVLHCQLPG